MQFGLFSNGQRRNAIARTTYMEDLDEIVLADELGMREAWLSEHGTFVSFQAPDQLPNADLFICKAIERTKQIKLGPGIRPLPFLPGPLVLRAALGALVPAAFQAGRRPVERVQRLDLVAGVADSHRLVLELCQPGGGKSRSRMCR